jgi:hypothetical protein
MNADLLLERWVARWLICAGSQQVSRLSKVIACGHPPGETLIRRSAQAPRAAVLPRWRTDLPQIDSHEMVGAGSRA